MQINKKLGRRLDPIEGDPNHVRASELCSEPSTVAWTFKRVLTKEEAHRWFHGNESVFEGDKLAPTVDEMLHAIANKLQEDVKTIMLRCSEDVGWLHDMYRRSKENRLSVTPTTR